MNLINELLIIAGCEPLSEAEISEITENNSLPSDFVNAVYNIVDIYEAHKNDTPKEQLLRKDIEYDTTLTLKHKNSPINGRTSKIFLRLGISDEAAKLLKQDTGFGLMHADKHRDEFFKILNSFPAKEKQIIQKYTRNNSQMEFILLAIPYIIKGLQYKRLSIDPQHPNEYMKDPTIKCTFIYGDAAFIFFTDLNRNIAFIHTFYSVNKSRKDAIINQNKLYRDFINNQN